MNVLVVYAHPSPDSFTHAILERVTRGLDDSPHSYRRFWGWRGGQSGATWRSDGFASPQDLGEAVDPAPVSRVARPRVEDHMKLRTRTRGVSEGCCRGGDSRRTTSKLGCMSRTPARTRSGLHPEPLCSSRPKEGWRSSTMFRNRVTPAKLVHDRTCTRWGTA